MLSDVLLLFAGLIIGLFIPFSSEISRGIKQRKKDKRYKKLMNGTPKQVINIKHFDQLYRYRNYPLYINGQVLGPRRLDGWHCNDEGKYLVDKNGDKAGYITSNIVRSKRLAKNRFRHYRKIVITENPTFLGKQINVSVVTQVY
jgi:hypothetical protein